MNNSIKIHVMHGASINYGQLLVEYLYQDWRYPIWPLNMILILRR